MAKQDQKIIDYKQCFGSEHGKRTLEHLKMWMKFYAAVVPNDSLGRIDPLEMARQLGERGVITHIEKMIKADPNQEKGIDDGR